MNSGDPPAAPTGDIFALLVLGNSLCPSHPASAPCPGGAPSPNEGWGGKRPPGMWGRPIQPLQPMEIQCVGAGQPAEPGRRGPPTALLGFMRPLNGGIVPWALVASRCCLLHRHQPRWTHQGRNLGALRPRGHEFSPERSFPKAVGFIRRSAVCRCPNHPLAFPVGLGREPLTTGPASIANPKSCEEPVGNQSCNEVPLDTGPVAGWAGIKGSAGTRARQSAPALGDVGGLPRWLEEEVQLL